MAIETHAWDLANEIRSEQDAADFINAVIALDDPITLQAAIGEVARIRGMASVAREAGLNEKSLYRALSEEGNPRISTLSKVLDSLGLVLRVEPKANCEAMHA